MAINSVDMTKALKNEAYAAQVIRSGLCTASERGQLATQWGPDKITKWESVDSTKYEITDDEKANAKAKGTQKAEEGARTDKDGNVSDFDGKADNTETKANTAATYANAGGAGAAGVAAIIAAVGKAHAGSAQAKASGFLVMASGIALLAQSLILKALNPNAEQADACDNMQSVLTEAQSDLQDADAEVAAVTEEITDSTDELLDLDNTSDKEQQKLEAEYQKLLDEEQRLIEKYEASKNGGEAFTSADKANFDRIQAQKGTFYGMITSLAENGNSEQEALTDRIESEQETFDNAAAKMEEVQGITDYQAEFDEATVDNSQEVKNCANIGIIASGVTLAAGALHAWKVGSLFASAEGLAAVAGMASATAAGLTFNNISTQQEDYNNRAQAGVDSRIATEGINTETMEHYEEDLDTYAADIEFNDEIVFEETKFGAPTQNTIGGDDANSENESTVKSDEDGVNPFAPPSNGSSDNGDSNPVDNADKKDKEV